MYRSLAFCLGVLLVLPPAMAQETAAPARKQLAPGVLQVISSDGRPVETFTGPLVIEDLTSPDLAWTPNFTAPTNTLVEKSKLVILRRNIWNLEFAFKPLRMIEVDVPQPDGRMQRKLIWYMVYRVKYAGQDLRPTPQGGGRFVTYPSTTPVSEEAKRFFPRFLLESKEFGKQYLDRLIPVAQAPIEARERVGRPLLNSVEITKVKIPLSDDRVDRSVWGLVTWEDVDPRIDYFSVYVGGLTNAYRVAPPDASAARSSQFLFKSLQLNFWRPGDYIDEHEKEIRYGVPVDDDPLRQERILEIFGLKERLDHLWVYR